MTEEQKVTPDSPPESLSDVDSLLHELDPEFSSSLSKINTEVGQIADIAGLESISISAEYLKEGGENKGDEPVAPPMPVAPEGKSIEIISGERFSKVCSEFFISTIFLFFQLAKEILKLALQLRSNPPLEVIKNAPTTLFPLVGKLISLLQILIRKIRSFSTLSYIKVASIIVLSLVIKLTLKDMATRLGPDSVKDPFLKDWSGVADAIYSLPSEEENENIDDPLRHPEYTILVHKIAANLKAPNPRRSPMITTELYVEASNQDAAIEIKDRELEVRDCLERVFETTTFEELDTKAGKEKLKIHIRSALDRILNKGHVKRVFFSSLNMVP